MVVHIYWLSCVLLGRDALQLSEGHMWHLQYAWVPLALFFFDRAIERRGVRDAIYLAVTLALMMYMGGIYPLPQAVLLLGLYALSMSLSRRSVRPLVSLAVAGVVAVGLAAPKLFVVADMMSKYPRKIASTEAISWEQLRLVFTDATGTISHDPIKMPEWGWHEYGIYVGVWLTGAMVLAILSSSAKGRPTALRFAGLVFLALGCGAFDQYAPWTLLHKLPAFSSQHVPSRALMIAVLALGLAFAALAARVVNRAVAALPWLDCVLLVPVFLIATNIAGVGELSSRDAFQFKGPAEIQASPEFHHVTELSYRYDPDWHQPGRQELLSMFANTGVIRCHTAPRELIPGAIAQGAGGYRGEAYLVSDAARQAPGTARVTSFTPNTATIHYEGATPGSTLVYNMNYDPSWRTSAGPIVSYRGAAAVVVTEAAGDVRFRYYPRTLNWGLALCAMHGGSRLEASSPRALAGTGDAACGRRRRRSLGDFRAGPHPRRPLHRDRRRAHPRQRWPARDRARGPRPLRVDELLHDVSRRVRWRLRVHWCRRARAHTHRRHGRPSHHLSQRDAESIDRRERLRHDLDRAESRGLCALPRVGRVLIGHEHHRNRAARPDPCERLEPVDARHRRVQRDDVGLEDLDASQRLVGVCRLRDDLDVTVGFEDLACDDTREVRVVTTTTRCRRLALIASEKGLASSRSSALRTLRTTPSGPSSFEMYPSSCDSAARHASSAALRPDHR